MKPTIFRYYVKDSKCKPGGSKAKEYIEKFEELTGIKLPYVMDEAVKFPGMNLSLLLFDFN